MTEPLTTAVVGGFGAGIGAMLVATLGIEPQPLFWAVFGGSLGLSAAADAGRVRAVSVFAAVVMCCSLFGTWLSERYFGSDGTSRNVMSCGLAICFHPLLNASVARLPQVIEAICKKLGIT